MRKMDEMELSINMKGIKWSWFFTTISLFIWGVFDYMKTQSTSLPLLLFTLNFLVYFFIVLISKWKAGDKNGIKSTVWYTLGVLFFIIVFGTILYFLIGQVSL